MWSRISQAALFLLGSLLGGGSTYLLATGTGRSYPNHVDEETDITPSNAAPSKEDTEGTHFFKYVTTVIVLKWTMQLL